LNRRVLRNDTNPYGKKVWGVVDRAAERAPEFAKRKLDEAFRVSREKERNISKVEPKKEDS